MVNLKIQLLLFAAFMFLISSLATCQQRFKFIGGETGIDVVFTSRIQNESLVRGGINSLTGDLSSNLKSFMYKSYVGFKVNYWSLDTKFDLSTGIRFSHLASSISKASTYASHTDFFYFMYAQTDNSIEYLKIKEINQVSDYVGLPIELTYNPFPRRRFTIYFKLGVELDFKIRSTNEVVFSNSAMNVYEGGVLKKFGEPDPFTALVKAAAGVRLGKFSKNILRFEIGPSVFITERASSLLTNAAGLGPQVSLLFAL